MGFNTTLMILNDGFGELEKHPEDFVQGIRHKMDEGGTLAVGNHANVVEVMKTQHADLSRLYYTHHNSIIELSSFNERTVKLATSDYPFQREFVKSMIKDAKRIIKYLEQDLKQYE